MSYGMRSSAQQTGQRRQKDWRQLLIDIINWNAVDRGMLPLMLALPLYLQVLGWSAYVLGRPDRDRLVHVAVVEQAGVVIGAMLVLTLLLFGLGFALRRRHPDAVWYQYLTSISYALCMCYCSWLIGTQSFVTGAVMLGGPVAGFILLDRRPVLIAFFIAFTVTFSLSVASALGYGAYAPLMVPPGDVESALFWTLTSYFLALIPLTVLIVLADRALSSWRSREAGIRAMSRTDALTGIHNRRSILELLDREIARTRRHGPPLAVVILDLDHFKRINDTWGHPTGDRVLQQAAELLGQCLRQCDAVGRYGGEEFLILLPDTTLEGARTLAERCRERLAALHIAADSGEEFRISGSFGLACNEQCLEHGAGMLIKAADEALYRAKEGGRNRVEAVAPPPGDAARRAARG
ncbi:MAG: diguanylate cyclase [Pseudomonadota bacterium]